MEALAQDPADARRAREDAEAVLRELEAASNPIALEINRLTRQVWVPRQQVADNRYDLSPNLYRFIERRDQYREDPVDTINRLRQLDDVAADGLAFIEKAVATEQW